MSSWDDIKHGHCVRAVEKAVEDVARNPDKEGSYWRDANTVRQHVFMARVRRGLHRDWNPEKVDYQSLAELKALAYERLIATIANHIDNNLTPPTTPPRRSDYDYI